MDRVGFEPTTSAAFLGCLLFITYLKEQLWKERECTPQILLLHFEMFKVVLCLVTEDKIILLPSRLLSKANLMSRHSDYYLLVMVVYWSFD
jgi:hypothetical protein